MFYSQQVSRKRLYKLQNFFNTSLFIPNDLKLYIKIDYLNIYLYILKPRLVMTEVLQDGILIQDESKITDVENLPTATVIDV